MKYLPLAIAVLLAGCASVPQDGKQPGLIAGIAIVGVLAVAAGLKADDDAPAAGPQCHIVISGGPNGSTTSSQVCN